MDQRPIQDHPGAGLRRHLTPAELAADARELIRRRVPFRHQGRSEQGLDCVGLPIFLLARRGLAPISLSRTDYGRLPMGELIQTIASLCDRIDAPVDGGLVLIRWPGEERPAHLALSVAGAHGLNLIHCYAREGRVVEHGFRGAWERRAHSFWRLPWVRDE